MQRSGYHHGSLPSALVAAALELLDEGGAEAVRVREVARRAGVSPGAPFRHFADREALLTAVAGEVLEDFAAWQGEAAGAAEGPVMRAFGLGFVRYAIRHPHRFGLLRSRVFGASQPEELRPRLGELELLLNGLVVAAQRDGELPPGDPEVVALGAQALVYGLAQMIVDGFLPAERAESLAEQVLNTYAATGY
ncbi:TetR/AcrR family transcriptional regulator [Streptomyces sp. A7024]|uniref:TetR/AcrR family transcriptional regulator n=2 Tax=Streptomyces coryli TaxID=1128680 RepID=A0A6G4UDG3_9ACTN|nr:TetR/AcrR family transcriptional regulator [Streptomyces coryli]